MLLKTRQERVVLEARVFFLFFWFGSFDFWLINRQMKLSPTRQGSQVIQSSSDLLQLSHFNQLKGKGHEKLSFIFGIKENCCSLSAPYKSSAYTESFLIWLQSITSLPNTQQWRVISRDKGELDVISRLLVQR